MPVGVVAYTLVGPGTAIVGGVLSTTLIRHEADPTFECASVALQVTLCGPSEKSVPDAGLQLTSASGPSRLSVAVGVANVTIEPAGPFASTELSGETPVSTGAVMSMRVSVTVNEACCVLPCVSVAEHVTGVVPRGKLAPDAGVQVTGRTPSTLSVADGLDGKETIAPPGSSVFCETPDGTPLRTGSVVSTSVRFTLNVVWLLL